MQRFYPGMSIEEFEKLFGPSGEMPDIEEIYKTTPWVHRAVNIVAWQVASAPWSLYKGNDEIKPRDLGIEVNWYDLLYLTAGSLMLYSRAYFWVNRAVLTGKPVKLVWLAAKNVEPIFGPNIGEIIGWRRAGIIEPFKYEDIIHVWNPSFELEDTWDSSPAETAAISASVLQMADKCIAAYFKRGAIQPLILTVPEETPDREISRLEKWWKRLVGGAEKAFETIGLRAEVEPKRLGDKPSDLAIDVLTADAKANISAAFGIPDNILSGKDTNYASGMAQRLNLIEQTVIPMCERIANAWNSRFFGPEFDMEMKFNYSRMEIYARIGAQVASDYVSAYAHGLIDKRRYRTLIGLPPVEHEDYVDDEPNPFIEKTKSGLKVQDVKALKDELRKWRDKVASKGNQVEFKSEIIPEEMQKLIKIYIKEHPNNPFGWMD